MTAWHQWAKPTSAYPMLSLSEVGTPVILNLKRSRSCMSGSMDGPTNPKSRDVKICDQ